MLHIARRNTYERRHRPLSHCARAPAPTAAAAATSPARRNNCRRPPLRVQDKAGTKKDSKYLRCLSNCLAGCQKPNYGEELGRDDCLQRCQDECCFSYAQCTYTVSQNK
jgi:hypothetical protein